jgi:hypothetical protein
VSERPPSSPPALVKRWESLESGKQAAIASPALAVVLTIVHLTILGQPFGRGLGYGIFWAIPATLVIVIATANERRKRQRRDDDPEP